VEWDATTPARLEDDAMKALIVFVGIAILAVGIGVGSHRITVADQGMTTTCGTAFNPRLVDAYAADRANAIKTRIDSAVKPTDFVTKCQNESDNWNYTAWGLTGLGVAVLLGGLFIRRRNRD
jgi:LPXTG-motif cell wall-anchored protein